MRPMKPHVVKSGAARRAVLKNCQYSVKVVGSQARARPPSSNGGVPPTQAQPETLLQRLFPSSGQQNQPLVTPPVQGAFKSSGKTVVITGGSQGVGRATALLFARKGYNVVVAARDAEKLKYVADDCAAVAGRQGASLGIVTDVSSERDVKDLVNTVLAKFESVDVVISNAGVQAQGSFLNTPSMEARRLMDVNYLGTYHVMQNFLPILLKQAQKRAGWERPSFVVVNGFAGKVPMKGMAAFTASKFAVQGLVEAVRAEVEPLGVHITSVSPGFVRSNFLERAEFYGPDKAEDRKFTRQLLRMLPLTQTPAEVADAVFGAVSSKSPEVIVGLPFSATAAAYRVAGINASALPFM